jgi:hypothetical protein
MMNRDEYNDAALKQYLLGELSGKELDALERQYLADSDLFERLLVVEDDLIDQYARGELNPTESKAFERQSLATPGQRERLVNAQVLLAVARGQRSAPVRPKQFFSNKRRSWLSVLGQRNTLAFATLLLLVVTAGIAVRWWRRNCEPAQIPAGSQLSQRKQPETQVALPGQPGDEKPPLPKQPESPVLPGKTERAPQIATFILPMTLTRSSGSANFFVLKPAIETVHLQALVARGSYKTYRAELQSADGDHLQSFTGMKPHPAANADMLLLNVPAKLLSRSDYILKVTGIGEGGRPEDAGFFSFRIVKE